MNCPHCGYGLPDGSTICTNCDRALHQIHDEEPDAPFEEPKPEPAKPAAPEPAPQARAAPSAQIPTKTMAIIAVAVVAVIALVVLGRPNINVEQRVDQKGPEIDVDVGQDGDSKDDEAETPQEDPPAEPEGDTSTDAPAEETAPGEGEAFEVEFRFYKEDGGAGTRITDGTELRSGDQFWIDFRPGTGCYVYVIDEGPSGEITPLYPRPDIGSGHFVAPGTWVRLPGDEHNYEVDDESGQETVTLIASLTPIEELDRLLAKCLEGDASADDKRLLDNEIRTRDIGIAPRVEKPAQGLELEKLEGRGSLVRKVVFQHR